MQSQSAHAKTVVHATKEYDIPTFMCMNTETATTDVFINTGMNKAAMVTGPPAPGSASTFSTNSTNVTSNSVHQYGGITWQRLGLTSQEPAVQSTVFLSLLLCLLFVRWFAKKFLFFPETPSAKIIKQRKSKTLRAAMRTALNWQDSALAKRSKDETVARNAANDQTNAAATDVKSAEQLDEELLTQMPSSEKIFNLLYDENEWRRTSYFGLEDTNDGAQLVRDVEQLFCKTNTYELQVAMRNIAMAKGTLPLKPWMHVSEVQPFADGSKLSDLVSNITEKYVKFMRPPPGVCGHLRTVLSCGFCVDQEFERVINIDVLEKAQATLKNLAQRRAQGYRMLWKLYWPTLPYFVLAVVAGMLKCTSDAWMFAEQFKLLDQIGKVGMEDAKQAFLDQTLPFLFVRFFCEMMGISAHTLVQYAKSQFLRDLRCALFQQVMKQDVEYFDRRKTEDIAKRMQSQAENLTNVLFGLPLTVTKCLTGILVSCYVVSTTCPSLTLIATVPPLFLGVLHLLICQSMFRCWGRREGLNRILNQKGVEILKKIRTVREFAMEMTESDLRSSKSQYTVETSMNVKAAEDIIWHYNGFCWTIQHCLLLHEGCKHVASGSISVGSLMAISHQVGRIAWSFRQLLEQTPQFAKAMLPLGAIADMLVAKSIIEGDPFENRRQDCDENVVALLNQTPNVSLTPKLLKPKRFVGHIEFRDVNFAYPKDPRKKILKELTFSNDPQGLNGRRIRTLGFVGKTGCGKSTAVSLLKRFYNPTSGSILLDGRPISEYDPRHLRQNMAIVAQKTQMLQRSIRENICYGMPVCPSDEEIIRCCIQASIWPDIDEMPDKLDTLIDDNLSGGQEQRIAIARALIRKPTILLLDEATSALDAVNERVVQKAIEKMMDARGEGCSITIAHRLSTIRNCDLICVIDKGHNVEQGTHHELMKLKSGFYKELWDTQMGEVKGPVKGGE